MVPAAEACAYGLERFIGKLLAKVHCHLPRVGNVHGAALRKKRVRIDIIIIAHNLLHKRYGDGRIVVSGNNILERRCRKGKVYGLFCKPCEGYNADEGAFKLANV